MQVTSLFDSPCLADIRSNLIWLFWAANGTKEKRRIEIILQTLAIGYNPSFVHCVNQNSEPKSVREFDLYDNNINNRGGKKQKYYKNKKASEKEAWSMRAGRRSHRTLLIDTIYFR